MCWIRSELNKNMCNYWILGANRQEDYPVQLGPEGRKKIAPYCVFFSWYLNNECNYKCSFCHPEDIKTVFIPVNKWIEIWDRLHVLYGSCHIHISGGEPFIYPGFIDLISAISKKHTLEFSTNLSQDVRPFIEKVGPDRARLGGSFHPEFAKFSEFLGKIGLLKEKKFDIWVNYVAYPPHLQEMRNYKEAVEALGIRFSIQPFNGVYAGRQYPQGYTPEEKALMTFGNIDDINKDTIDWRTDGKKSSVKGKMCRMGQMYARIYPDGEVSRCCGAGAMKLGNIIKGTFLLSEEPLPCAAENCPCWKCMLVDKDKYWLTYWTTPNRTNLIGHE